MELDARYVSQLRIARLIVELTRHRIDRVMTSGTGCDLVTQLLEIVLEDIDDFV